MLQRESRRVAQNRNVHMGAMTILRAASSMTILSHAELSAKTAGSCWITDAQASLPNPGPSPRSPSLLKLGCRSLAVHALAVAILSC